MRILIALVCILMLVGTGIADDPHIYHFNVSNEEYNNGVQDGIELLTAFIQKVALNDDTAFASAITQLAEQNETAAQILQDRMDKYMKEKEE